MRALIILIILGGSIYFWQQRKSREERFDTLTAAARSSRNDLDLKKRDQAKILEKLEPMRLAKAEAEGKGTSVEKLTEEVAALQDELNTASVTVDEAEKAFVKEMEAVRDYAKKQVLPALKLASGDELLECSISKFGEGYISITHREGVQKVQGDDLPAGWVQRYSIDYVARDTEADKEALAAKVDAVVLTEAQIKALQISELDEKIHNLETQLLALSVQVRDKSRQADKLVRDAYRVALRRGSTGADARAKRSSMFSEAKRHEQEREVIRAKYTALREQRKTLEKRRQQLRYSRT